MAVIDQNALLRGKDESGNERLFYPITKIECVDGAEDLVHYDQEQELTAVQKAQFLKNIGGLCAPEGAQVNQFLKVTAVDENGNVTAVETAEVEGGSGGDSGSSCTCPTGTIGILYNLTWNTSVTPTVTFDVTAAGYTCYKVSDVTLTKEQMMSADWNTSSYDGSTMYNFTLTDSDIASENEDGILLSIDSADGLGLAIIYNAGETTFNYSGNDLAVTTPETGTYIIFTSSASLPNTCTGSATGTTEQEANFVQSDWNQNDSTQPDYVKNRPFYGETETIVAETTVTFTNDGSEWIAEAELSFTGNLVENQSYTVVWDSVEYTCQCLLVDGLLTIGNIGLLTGGDDTGEPFIIGQDGTEGICVSIELAMNPTDLTLNSTHTCEIIGNVIHPLSNKYLSFMTDSWETEEILPAQSLSFVLDSEDTTTPANSEYITAYIETDGVADNTSTIDKSVADALSKITAGRKYTVIIDGSTYVVAAVDMSNQAPTGYTVRKYVMLTDSSSIFSIIYADVTSSEGSSMIQVLIMCRHTPDADTISVPVSVRLPAGGLIDEAYLPEPNIPSELPEYTSSYSGCVLMVNSSGGLAWSTVVHPAELPAYTSADAGKVPTVSSTGTITWETPSASSGSSGLPEITTDDTGKVLTVDSSGAVVWETPATSSGSALPSAAASDAGKVLTVDSSGTAVWETPTGSSDLPEVTTEDNGKVLGVVDGVWGKTAMSGENVVMSDGRSLEAVIAALTPVVLTQAEYDSLVTAGNVDENRNYLIVEGDTE